VHLHAIADLDSGALQTLQVKKAEEGSFSLATCSFCSFYSVVSER
jgi:hypothetical protein